ncbi:MAG: DUF302 domain-containing protein, partial [Jiangellaceae bacterium]
SYGTKITLAVPFEDAVSQVRAALADEGFGILSEIDVQATLRARIGAEIEPYLILGACNPPLAHQALEVDRSIGLLLPCNVVVRGAGDSTVIEMLDPQVMVTVTGEADLEPVAGEAGRRLTAAVEAIRN